jgi:transcriptional regulator with XRE-family HTH domain
VGWLVARARAAAGSTDRDLADAVGVPLRLVRVWERGDAVPTDDEMEAIALACGTRLTELLPRRDSVLFDRATGIMRMGDEAVAIGPGAADNDDILSAFVTMVRRQRGLRPGDDVKLRQEDLDALVEALDLDDDELEERLVGLIGMSRSQAAAVRAQLLRRRLAVPVVGMLAGIGLLSFNRLVTRPSDLVKAIDDTPSSVLGRTSTTMRAVPTGSPADLPGGLKPHASPAVVPSPTIGTTTSTVSSVLAGDTTTSSLLTGPAASLYRGHPSTAPAVPTPPTSTPPTYQGPDTSGAPPTASPVTTTAPPSSTPSTVPVTSPPTTTPPTHPPTVPTIPSGGGTEGGGGGATTTTTTAPPPPPTTTTTTTAPHPTTTTTTSTTVAPPPPPPPPPVTGLPPGVLGGGGGTQGGGSGGTTTTTVAPGH